MPVKVAIKILLHYDINNMLFKDITHVSRFFIPFEIFSNSLVNNKVIQKPPMLTNKSFTAFFFGLKTCLLFLPFCGFPNMLNCDINEQVNNLKCQIVKKYNKKQKPSFDLFLPYPIFQSALL